MKRLLFVCFILAILLCSCSSSTNWNDPSIYNSGHEFSVCSENYTAEFNDEEKKLRINDFYGEVDNIEIVFADPQALLSGLKKDIADELAARYDKNNDKAGKLSDYIKNVKDIGKVTLPFFDGKLMRIPTDNGCGYCSLYASLYFDRPGLMFPIDVDRNRVLINTVLIDDGIEKSTETSDIIKKMSPDSPNTDNFRSFRHIKSAYKSALPLADRVVDAVVFEYDYKDYNRIKFCFVYDDVIVVVESEPELVKNGLLKRMSFKSVMFD